jgi:ribonuclease HI
LDVGLVRLPKLDLGELADSRDFSRCPARDIATSMHTPLPHYLLHAETYCSGRRKRRWKFVLQAVGGDERLSAADAETTSRRSRLELLAVVRGLEALDRPAQVTLLTRSRYVSRGIRRQLSQWREHQWRWERFGSVVPIRDYDLWRRIDRALEYHKVECCVWQADRAKTRKPRYSSQPGGWTLSAALAKLRHSVLTPLTAILRPTFTRAA